MTPFIFQASRARFSYDLFARFCAFYVDGFESLFRVLKFAGLKNVFYPSSVAIDEHPLGMSEYVAAKLAGEVLCAFLSRTNRQIRFLIPRLPRLATDQTVSILRVDNEDPVPVMLRHLRAMSAAQPGGHAVDG